MTEKSSLASPSGSGVEGKHVRGNVEGTPYIHFWD